MRSWAVESLLLMAERWEKDMSHGNDTYQHLYYTEISIMGEGPERTLNPKFFHAQAHPARNRYPNPSPNPNPNPYFKYVLPALPKL